MKPGTSNPRILGKLRSGRDNNRPTEKLQFNFALPWGAIFNVSASAARACVSSVRLAGSKRARITRLRRDSFRTVPGMGRQYANGVEARQRAIFLDAVDEPLCDLAD
jgi:hypothetical protein